ncbi:PREDICTED: WD repeat-containing protein 92-like [Amphimedon queenslandica]|uniref:Dynein axonemal assembly factor 10 n=1 Tax=Amphimedon queenslandica TaxID=400682 RepID=A0A1X7UXK5_AMPQE|nr:PREDICTED: WD repeat-containing protein 92-like [Amphimedon queenslandica]|eukprot:XP_011403803.2 PREDICTED: WD repeat-containing protein 92-like [Amphimedon queenslandica]
MDKPQIIAHVEKSLNFTLYDAKWIPCSAKCVVLGSHPRDTGAFHIYELSKGELKSIKESEKKHSFKCGTFGGTSLHQRNLATGDFAGFLQIWDLEKTDLPIYSVKGHELIINAIDGVGGLGIGGGAPEIVTGSRDGTVKVWDPRQKGTPVATMSPAEGDMKRDCWAVAFGNSYNDEERCVVSGYDNGDIKMFDLRTMTLKWETNVKNGVCGLEFDRKDIPMNKLVSATLESKFNLFDLRTFHPAKGYTSLTEKYHKSTTLWCARHSPHNRDLFMTTGGDGSISLWKYSYPSKRSKADEGGHEVGVVGSVGLLQTVTFSTQPISSLDWSPDKEGLLVTTSFDQTVRICLVTRLSTC